MLALLRERRDTDDAIERDVVRAQRAEITSLRLRRLWCQGRHDVSERSEHGVAADEPPTDRSGGAR
jgi:hypothetical protein